MTIEKTNTARIHNSFLPVAAAAMLFIPNVKANNTVNLLEKQPKADSFEFSAGDIIDIKDDGSYKLVNPNHVDKTTYLNAQGKTKVYEPLPVQKNKSEKDNISYKKILAFLIFLSIAGAYVKERHEGNEKDKIINSIGNSLLSAKIKLKEKDKTISELENKLEDVTQTLKEFKAENKALNKIIIDNHIKTEGI